MLLKKKKIIALLCVSLLFGLPFTSCDKDDPRPVDDVIIDPGDDTTDDPTDDETGSGVFDGDIDWIKTYGGSGADEAVAVLATGDGYLVVGTARSNDGDLSDKVDDDADYWILKLSESGDIVWSKTYGGSADDVATDVSATSDGGYIISGHSRSDDGDVSGNAGFHDYWLLKVDANGNKQWDKSYGYSGSDQAFTAFETTDGGYFTTGFFDVTASEGEGNDDRANNGTLHGVGEYWCIKMDSSGEYIWRRYFGGTNNDRSYEAIQTEDGGFLVAGASESLDFDIVDGKGSYDFWVVKLDADGSKSWTKSFGGSEIDNGFAITKTNDGNFLFVGDTRSNDQDVSNTLGNADLWMVKMSSSGNLIWEKSIGGSQFESAKSIIPIQNDNYLIAGSTRSNDGDVTSNNGENDIWTLVIDKDGEILFEKNIGGSAFDFGEDAILSNDNSNIVLVGNTESDDIDIPEFQGVKDFLIVKIK